MRTRQSVRLISTSAMTVLLVIESIALGADTRPTVPRQLAAVFKAKCVRCHGTRNPKSGLDLSTPDGIFKGGGSGRGIVPGKSEDSLLFQMIRDGEMPPKDEGSLSKEQVEAVRNWIEGLSNTTRRVTWDQIHPILLLRCTACHGAQRREADPANAADDSQRRKVWPGDRSRKSWREPAFEAGRSRRNAAAASACGSQH